jgi:hypothetical protein
MMYRFGDTVFRLDKVNAIHHNTKGSDGPTNMVDVYLDDAVGSVVQVRFYDYETASDSVELFKEELQQFLDA